MHSKFILILTICIAVNAAPEIFTQNINSIPDYYQRDNSFGGFPKGGAVYCGPVTASNSLFWYAKNGYPQIFQMTDNPKKDQFKLISILGSPSYINTNAGGSSPDMICTGVQKFLEEKKIKDIVIKFYGWRQVRDKFKTSTTIPDLLMAKEALLKNQAVWLNIGWYNHNQRKNEYKRTGGHWVTLVGYGHDGKKKAPDILIIHDSETRWRNNDYIRIKKILNGRLTGKLKNLPRDATDYSYFSNGGILGIIEGMIILEMPQKNNETVS